MEGLARCGSEVVEPRTCATEQRRAGRRPEAAKNAGGVDRPETSFPNAHSAGASCPAGVFPSSGLLGCRRTAIPASNEQRGRVSKD